MEFFHSFVPVSMKYDFTSDNYGPNVAKDWTECRVNVKPNVTKRCIRIAIYPKHYDETSPNFILDINAASINGGTVKSRSKANVFGVLWNDEQNKKCRIFIAFDNKRGRQNFGKYFEELVKLYGNDGSTIENAETADSGHAQPNASSIQIMRVSNASSGSCEDVVLRPKPVAQNRRLVRSFAAISGFFKSTRDSGTNHSKKIGENSPNESSHLNGLSRRDTADVTKRKTWNFFKLKEKLSRSDNSDAAPSFQHFQEPLNFERPSLVRGDINLYSDAEWYDLNKDEMSMFEARLSTVVSEFNSYNKISSNCGGNDDDDGGESSNALRLHNNLSTSHDSKRENGTQNQFETKQSIQSKKSVKPSILIDGIMTKAIDADCNCDSDESCKLSSGFGSGNESDTNSPQEFARRFKAFSNSPAASDFFEAVFSSVRTNVSNECVPATDTNGVIGIVNDATAFVSNTQNMQKISKKSHIESNSRRIFGMLHGKHTSSPSVNVTPQNKSPTDCRPKKVRNGTPFKIRPMKQMDGTVVDSQRILYPLEI